MNRKLRKTQVQSSQQPHQTCPHPLGIKSLCIYSSPMLIRFNLGYSPTLAQLLHNFPMSLHILHPELARCYKSSLISHKDHRQIWHILYRNIISLPLSLSNIQENCHHHVISYVNAITIISLLQQISQSPIQGKVPRLYGDCEAHQKKDLMVRNASQITHVCFLHTQRSKEIKDKVLLHITVNKQGRSGEDIHSQNYLSWLGEVKPPQKKQRVHIE